MNSIEVWLTQPGGIAPRLRGIREEAGLTGTVLAGMLGWPQSKISKLENGKQTPTAVDIAAWVRVCRGSEDAVLELQAALDEAEELRRDWRTQARRGQVGIQHDYDELARNATVIRNFEIAWVPGLLQTLGYARYRAMEGVDLHEANPDEIEATARARMRRQDVLYEGGRRFEFVIGEEALHRLLCPPDVMLGQLARLDVVAAGIPDVTFGIIPFSRQMSLSPQHGFVIYDNVAIVENFIEELTYRPEYTQRLSAVMDRFAAEAVFGDDARALIVRAMENLRRDT